MPCIDVFLRAIFPFCIQTERINDMVHLVRGKGKSGRYMLYNHYYVTLPPALITP